jgi:heat shock protein HslJ
VPHHVVARLVRLARLVLLVAIVVAIGGCSDEVGPSASPPPGGISTLTGTSWIVVSVNGRSPIAGAVPTLAFDAGQIKGFFGCNQGGGRYRLDGATGRFDVQDLAETAMGCLQPGVTEFESVLVQVLGGATQVTLDPTGQLILSGPGGRIILVTLEHPALGS